MSAAPRVDVSVCIANFDGELLLKDCLDSVLAQSADVALEIVVHDDASTDGSIALLERDYPTVRIIASARNVGFCIANNRMADVASGRYLLLLNNDAALQPGALRALVDAADRQPAVLTLPQYDWIDGHLIDRGCRLDPFLNPVPNLDTSRQDVAMAIGACLFLPTALWRELGGFPEWMESIGEDLYLCGLARLRGTPVRVVDGPGYRHRQGASFGGNRVADGGLRSTYRRRALSERNKTAALCILTPAPWVLPLLASHLALLAIEGAALSVAGMSAEPWRRIYWPALATPLRESRVLCSHRRRIQSRREIGAWRWFATTAWWPRKLAMLFRYGLPSLR